MSVKSRLRPLVGGEAAGEPDGQRVRIEGRLGGFDQLLAVGVASALGFRLTPDEIHQRGFQRAVGFP